VTFPHAGDYYIAFEYLFRKIGYDVRVAPRTSQRTLEAGVSASPEKACLPFKITLGNLVESLEQDPEINVVVMIGGKTGMCRLAYYSTLYRKILEERGHGFHLLPFKLKREMWDTIKGHFPELKLRDFVAHAYGFWQKMRALEEVREHSLKIRPRERQKGATTALYNRLIEAVAEADCVAAIRQLRRQIPGEFAAIPIDPKREVLRIGLVGEFYFLIDQFSTMNLEKFLGEIGCEVTPSLTFSEFFVGSVKQIRFLDHYLPTERHRVARLAKPYINRPIGGHGMQSLGQAIRYKQLGYDGVVHLYPFTCMPEIIANSLFEQVSRDHDIPVLSLCLDEHSGFAGVQTRLEAFVDMMGRKRMAA
jgi:predicted nucleotide-binding protein (sugar kinase/HSP70/actin superfamily)